MVLYFSGTGNSRFVAVRIAERISDDDIVSINQCMKEGDKKTFCTKRPLVFVVPTYAWRMPRVVERWIRENRFEGCGDAYFILTCGGGCGNAGAYAEKLCGEKGLRFRGLAPAVMPENYLALFPTPGKRECRAIIEKATPGVDALAKTIRAGKSFNGPSVSLGEKLESGPVNPLFYALFVRDRGFTVSERCTSCGKCAQRCPLNNIRIQNGKPV